MLCLGISAYVGIRFSIGKRRVVPILLSLGCCVLFFFWACRNVGHVLSGWIADEELSTLALQIAGVNLLPMALIGCGVCLVRDFGWRDLCTLRAFRLLGGLVACAALLGTAYRATRALLLNAGG